MPRTASVDHGAAFSTAGTAARTARRFHWPRVFGYDFFISFKLGPPPLGAQSYASDLARRLRELDFTVFFSEEEAPPGAELDGTLARALGRSSVLVVVVTEGALTHSKWVRKEVEEFRRAHPRRPVIPIVVDRAIDTFGAAADASRWLDHDGRIWLDETREALDAGIASVHVLERLAVSHRFIRANTWFRWAVGSTMVLLAGLASWAGYAAWDANRRFREATALRLAAEGAAMTAAERPGGSARGLWQVLAAHRMVPSADADEAVQGEFLKFQRQLAIRETAHPIDSLAFSPDGRSIASGSHDGYLQLWDAITAQPDGDPWRGHGPVSSVAFGPGRGRLVSASPDGSIEQWDLSDRRPLPPDPGMPAPWFNWSTTISRDGARVAWGREMGEVLLWDIASRSLAHLKEDAARLVGPPLGLAVSSDGRLVAYYSYTGGVGVIDSAPGPGGASKVIWSANIRSHTSGFGPTNNYGVRSGVVAFSPDGSLIASGSTGGSLEWWNAATGEAISRQSGAHGTGVTALLFSPDGTVLASGGSDGGVRMWSTKTQTPVNGSEAAHTGPVTALAFSDDGRRMASAGLDGTLRLWTPSDAVVLGREALKHRDGPTAVALTQDGQPLVIGAEVRNMGKAPPQVFTRSPDGRRQVVRDGRTLSLVDTSTGRVVTPLLRDSVPVQNVVFSPSGARLASLADAGVVLFWNAETGRLLTALRTDSSGIAGFAMDAGGTRLATGGYNGSLRLWSVDQGTEVVPAIKAHEGTVRGLAFSPDGRRIASAGEDRILKIWDASTGRPLTGPLVGHEAGVSSVAFSPDGQRLVSGGGIPYSVSNEQPRVDYSLRLWDATTGRPIGRPLRGHEHDVRSVAFSADGKRVVSASLDDSIRVWDVFGAWADALCAKLPRNPTTSEWREWVSPSIGYVCPCPGLGTERACRNATSR